MIGGSSAGATIQGDYLVRGAVAGSEIVMTPEPEHEHGFAFLRRSRDRPAHQHAQSLGRHHSCDQEVSQSAGHRTFEGTAIVVTGDRFEVIGKWKVADPRQHSRLPALGEALLRALARRRVQHEDTPDREVRHRRARARHAHAREIVRTK